MDFVERVEDRVPWRRTSRNTGGSARILSPVFRANILDAVFAPSRVSSVRARIRARRLKCICGNIERRIIRYLHDRNCSNRSIDQDESPTEQCRFTQVRESQRLEPLPTAIVSRQKSPCSPIAYRSRLKPRSEGIERVDLGQRRYRKREASSSSSSSQPPGRRSSA